MKNHREYRDGISQNKTFLKVKIYDSSLEHTLFTSYRKYVKMNAKEKLK